VSRKRIKKPNTTEMTDTDKVKYYKGQLKRMDKILNNIEKRLQLIEKKLEKVKLEPVDVIEKSDSECFNRTEFLKKFHPTFKEKE